MADEAGPTGGGGQAFEVWKVERRALTEAWSLERPRIVVAWRFLMPLGKIAYSPLQPSFKRIKMKLTRLELESLEGWQSEGGPYESKRDCSTIQE